MHIKQIIIQGFKSYKDQTVIEPFSPKHNVIVGRNGSGKSNFFAAIRFVLSDAYGQLGREERQALLHEGAGPAVMSGFVEIIFDNTDGRFPTGKPEVIIRRTIGMKKDEYTLDRKNATKQDVMNLLESAGFSRSNPYYIVPQGRVTALTNMKDQDRLSLLKEVAGTQVYEARRTESLKIMADTDNKLKKIDETREFIMERLSELEAEKAELRDYQEKEKERRCLQYTIDFRDQEEITEKLETIDNERRADIEHASTNRDQLVQFEREIQEINSEISKLKQQEEFLSVDKTELESERRQAAKTKAKAELDLKAITDSQASSMKSKKQFDAEVKQLQKDIRDRETELSKILPTFSAHLAEEAQAREQLDGAENARQRLYSKQGRNAKFKSKKDRDDWLRKQIQEAKPQQASFEAIRDQAISEISAIEQQVEAHRSSIEDLRAQLNQRSTSDQEMSKQLEEACKKRDALMDERKILWREDAKLVSVHTNAEDDLKKAERNLAHKMDGNTARGLAAIQRIKQQHKIEGLYGTVAELMDVNERFRTAVETSAGASLFHYIVDTDQTAGKVVDILQKERSGRVTFMPLNVLRIKESNVPKAPDAVPIMEKISFDPKFEAAYQHIFGNTLVCASLIIASQYARSHGVTALTLDGDRSDKRGALSGGSVDPRQSRLDAIRDVTKAREHFYETETKRTELKKRLGKLDQEVTQAVSNVHRLEIEKNRKDNNYGPLARNLQTETSALQQKETTLETKTKARAATESNLRNLLEQIAAHEAEMSSEFRKVLTDAEESQFESLGSSIQQMRQQFSSILTKRSELESRKSELEIDLRESLRPRLDQLNAQAIENESYSSSALTTAEKNLEKAKDTLVALEERLLEVDQSHEDIAVTITETQQRLDSIKKREQELHTTLNAQQRKMEKSIQKKSLLNRLAAEAAARIRDLGVLPQEAFSKYAKMDYNVISKRLAKTNDALKKYSHVNKKAFQQYDQFKAEEAEFSKRRAELEKSHDKIEELVAALDHRKDEAIERTFKQVSKEFSTVFETLVPAGRGRLIIQKRMDRANERDEDDSDAENTRNSVENYTGVGISVSFNSKHDEQQRIQQLSGGQKSLCALTLVFAIQRCDPAPFYLFDEIDANLDAQYRTAVAQMLHSLSQDEAGGQFICTTFRPEMLLVAEKCYGVTFVGKSSNVVTVTREEAMDFVVGEKQ